jgi:hypothetical protein
MQVLAEVEGLFYTPANFGSGNPYERLLRNESLKTGPGGPVFSEPNGRYKLLLKLQLGTLPLMEKVPTVTSVPDGVMFALSL